MRHKTLEHFTWIRVSDETMIETIDIRNKSIVTMANILSDWLLAFYTF